MILYAYASFFLVIHHLGCFHFGNHESICFEHVSTYFCVDIFFSVCSVGLYFKVIRSVWKRMSNCFPQQLNYLTFPLVMHEGFTFSTASPTLVSVCLVDDSHSSREKRYPIVVLISSSLMTNDVVHLFSCLMAIHTMHLLWWNVYSAFFPLFKIFLEMERRDRGRGRERS